MISVISVLNGTEDHFKQTAISLLNQTFPWFEWIIVAVARTGDDGEEMLRELEESDSRIRIIRQPCTGLGTARNIAVRASASDILIPLSVGDLLEVSFLECVYWTLDTNKDAGLAYSNVVDFDGIQQLWCAPFDSDRMKNTNLIRSCAGIRKADLIEAGLYDEGCSDGDVDWMLWMKLLAIGKKPVHMNWYGSWKRKEIHPRRSASSNGLPVIATPENIGAVQALEYPIRETVDEFQTFRTWDFRHCIKENDKIKIAMLLPYMVVGGAEKFILDLISGMDKERFEIHILTTVDSPSPWRQKFEEHADSVFDLTTFLDVRQWASFTDYFIKAHRIDILFLSNSYFGYYLLPWLVKNNGNLPIYDYVHMDYPSWRNGAYARTTGVLGSFLEKTFTCNNLTRDTLIHSYDRAADSVETVYIGVDADKFNPDLYEKGGVRQEFGIGINRKILLFPCRIDDQKRPFLMLEIAEQIHKEDPDGYAFIVVGDGPLLEELKDRTVYKGLSDVVYFAGRRENMAEMYMDADLTLICSLTEGLSLTSYESLSMEVPCISADVGGQKELIDDAVGKLIPCRQDIAIDLQNRNYAQEEIKDYVRAIIDLLHEEERLVKMKNHCRKRILEGFSKKIMVKRFEDIFLERRHHCGPIGSYKEIKTLGNLADDYLSLYLQHEGHEIRIDQMMNRIIELERNVEENHREVVRQEGVKYLAKKIAKNLRNRLPWPGLDGRTEKE